MPIPGLLAALPALTQLGTSIYQGVQGRKLGEAEAPQYEIPSSIEESLKNARMMASMRELPGQSTIEDKLRGSTASATSAIKQQGGGGAGMGAIVEAFANEQSVMGDIGIEAERMWRDSQGDYRSELGRKAQYEDKQFQINELDPYLAQMQQSSDLKGASIANLFGSAKGGVQSLMDLSALGQEQKNSEQYLELMRQIFAGAGGTGGTSSSTGGAGTVEVDPRFNKL